MEQVYERRLCRGVPAASVVRAHLHVERRGVVTADVDRVYGAPAPTSAVPARFAALEDDETLLVSLAPDGAVLGQGWPVYDGKLALEGLPEMSEGEAVALLLSPRCRDELASLHDRGERPAAVPALASHGCACHVHASALDATSVVAAFVAAALTLATLLRRRAR